MTREEAIKRIRDFGLYHAISDLPYSTKTVEAFEMAIKALSQPEPCEDVFTLDDFIKELDIAIKQDGHDIYIKADGAKMLKGLLRNQMGDSISRQAAIEVLSLGKEMLSRVLDDSGVVGADREKYSWGLRLIESNIKDIEELPPAQPERKNSKWIYGEHDVAMCDGYWCNKCGFFVPWDYQHKFIDFIKDYNFCPSCGSCMMGV